jgi:hypothetical protein
MCIISRWTYAYLHGLVKVEDLVLGLGLKEVEPGVQLLGSLADVSDDLTLVLLDLLADLLQEGDAVAGRVPTPEKIT